MAEREDTNAQLRLSTNERLIEALEAAQRVYKNRDWDQWAWSWIRGMDKTLDAAVAALVLPTKELATEGPAYFGVLSAFSATSAVVWWTLHPEYEDLVHRLCKMAMTDAARAAESSS